MIKQTDSLKQSGLDSNLLETSDMISKNMDGLKNSGKAFEKEMQARFNVINESIKKLKYSKSMLLEDLDQLIKQQVFDLTKETDVEVTPLHPQKQAQAILHEKITPKP